MFKKPLAHQSNATPIRSSARRQLVTAIFVQYPLLLGPIGGQDGQPNEKELGKVIVPEGIRSGTFETSGGIQGTMYFDQETPLWMTFGRGSKEYVPTLSLLSLPLPHPPLPILQIHHPLPPPLLTGAPLFVPALRNLAKPWFIPDVPEGGMVAFVISLDNGLEVEYVGVGRVVAKGGVCGAVERRIRKLRDSADEEEGKFCEVLCIKDDHLWEMGSKPVMPTFTLPIPPNPLAPPPSASSTSTSEQEAGRSDTPNSMNGASESISKLSLKDQSHQTAATLSPNDISTLLNLALLQTLSPESTHPNFPIPASQLYSGYILPNRPAYIPKEQREDVVIAKSEWKKLAKWMKEASKDGLLKIKESKGEVIVQSFEPTHPAILGHTTFLTIAEEDKRNAKRAAREEAGNGNTVLGSKGSKELDIQELWRPNGSAVDFWEAAGVEKTSLNPPGTIRSAFEGYVTKRALVHSQDHRMVTLDEELGQAIGVRNPVGQTMPRDEVLNRLRAGVAWAVAVNGVVRKGQLQPITMTVKTRQGRKTVTLVAGLEAFGVDLEEFAEDLRRLCAGSASRESSFGISLTIVQPLTGSSPKLNLQEIMVQGSQVKVITQALLTRGVPKRWIKEVDGGKKK